VAAAAVEWNKRAVALAKRAAANGKSREPRGLRTPVVVAQAAAQREKKRAAVAEGRKQSSFVEPLNY